MLRIRSEEPVLFDGSGYELFCSDQYLEPHRTFFGGS